MSEMNDWIISESGRRFKRNEENTGTIMEWNDNGTTRYTVVYDAQYRAVKPYYSGWMTDLGLPTYQDYGEIDEDYERKTADNYTDDYLNSLSCCTQDERSNHDATQAIVDYDSSDDNAANYCRGLTNLNPNGVDLPTINCLARIWADAEILDSMDPTVDEYSEHSLENWFSDADEVAWSASWYGVGGPYYFALGGHSNGFVYYGALFVNNDGCLYYGYQNSNFGVCPVLDID